MSASDRLSSRNLKKQLQTATAKRRWDNHAETRVVAALNDQGRNDLQPNLSTVLPIKDLRPSDNRTRETTPQILEA